jgi:hypothetical protein
VKVNVKRAAAAWRPVDFRKPHTSREYHEIQFVRTDSFDFSCFLIKRHVNMFGQTFEKGVPLIRPMGDIKLSRLWYQSAFQAKISRFSHCSSRHTLISGRLVPPFGPCHPPAPVAGWVANGRINNLLSM